MPEAAGNKNGNTLAREDKVWLANDCAFMPNVIMNRVLVVQ
jgi:hypothetical protein